MKRIIFLSFDMGTFPGPNFRRKYISAIHFRIFDQEFDQNQHKILHFSSLQGDGMTENNRKREVLMQNKDLVEELFELLDTADIIYVQSNEAKQRLQALLFDVTGKYNLISFEKQVECSHLK